MIKNHAHWIPGNGKRIQLWNDRIMDRSPLEEAGNFAALRNWLDAAHVHTVGHLDVDRGLLDGLETVIGAQRTAK